MSEAIKSARREAQQRGIDLLRALRGWRPMADNNNSVWDSVHKRVNRERLTTSRIRDMETHEIVAWIHQLEDECEKLTEIARTYELGMAKKWAELDALKDNK